MVDFPALLSAALTAVVPATVVEELLAVAEADAAFLAPKSRESLYYHGRGGGCCGTDPRVHVTSNATHLLSVHMSCMASHNSSL